MTLLDTVSVPEIDAQDRANRLNEAGSAWFKRIADDASSALLTYKVRGVGEGSVATKITAGRHEFFIDEPAALAGDDVAASPVEYALGALISCQIVVYRLYANALGIRVDDIQIDADAVLDARTLFGIEGGSRAGFTDVRLNVKVTGPESAERYQELQDAVEAHCPVLDLFSNPTPVSAVVTKV